MEYTSDTKMSDIPDDLSVEEASKVFASPFDDTARSLVHTLTHLGMSEEDYEGLVESAGAIVHDGSEILAMKERGLIDPTVAEYEPATFLNDLTLIGLLAHTIYMNKDLASEALENVAVANYLERILKGEKEEGQ